MKRQRDYSQSIYKNPYIRGKKKSKNKKIVSWLAIIFLLAAIIYISFKEENFLTIRNVEVEGTKAVDAKQIIELVKNQTNQRRFFIKQSNILFFNKKEAKNSIIQEFAVKSVDIQKKYFDTVTIYITEESLTAVWVTGDKSYYLNQEGIVVGQVTESQLREKDLGNAELLRHQVVQQDLPIIYDKNNSNINLNTTFTNVDYSISIFNLIKLLPDSLNKEVLHYEADLTAQRVDAVLKEGWTVFFSLSSPIEEQISNLKLFISEKVKDPKKIEYIDVRFGEKIYYKEK